MEEYASTIFDPALRIFTVALAQAFLSGESIGVCSKWAQQKTTSVSLVWRSDLNDTELNPYGSIYDDADAHAPPIDYCLQGNATQMWEVYWPVVNETGQ